MLRKYGLHVATFAILEAILVKSDGSTDGKVRATVAFISAAIAGTWWLSQWPGMLL